MTREGDLISRQAVLDAMYELCNTRETLKENPWRDNPHIDAIIDAIDNLPSVKQEPNKEAYNQGYEDGYLAGQKNIAERFEGLIKSGISTDTPDDIKYVIGLLNNLPPVNLQKTQMIDKSNFDQEQYKADLQCAYNCGKASVNPQEPLTEEDYIELNDRFGDYVVFVVKDMVSGKGERWSKNNPQEPKYCDRNICISNEYNGISCSECEVTKSQEPKTGQFAKWVATEIFDDNWEYNKDAFAELACRKLAELGIVRAKGEEWELVDSQESEDEEGEQPKIIKCPNCGNVQFADKEWCPDCGCRMVEPQESEEV